MQTIEKGVQVPKQRTKYVFSQMEVGDSIFFFGETQDSNCVAAAKMYFKRNGKRMTTKTEHGGIRIWRVV